MGTAVRFVRVTASTSTEKSEGDGALALKIKNPHEHTTALFLRPETRMRTGANYTKRDEELALIAIPLSVRPPNTKSQKFPVLLRSVATKSSALAPLVR